MNDDHQDSLAAFARHYASVPASSADSAVMTDVSFSSMTLSVDGGKRTVSVPINPPLSSWNDARTRLRVMTEEAADAGTEGGGVVEEPVSVTRFIWPSPIGWLIFVGVCSGYYSFWYPENLARGTWIRKYFLMDIHLLADLLMDYGRVAWWLILAIHVFESVLLWNTRLRVHAKKCGWGTKLLWLSGTMFEGFPTFIRFDREVRRLKAEMKKGK